MEHKLQCATLIECFGVCVRICEIVSVIVLMMVLDETPLSLSQSLFLSLSVSFTYFSPPRCALLLANYQCR